MAVDLAATTEQVWRAVSEADEIAKWFAPVVRIGDEPEPHIFLSWGEGMAVEVPIELVEPERRIRHRFGENSATRRRPADC